MPRRELAAQQRRQPFVLALVLLRDKGDGEVGRRAVEVPRDRRGHLAHGGLERRRRRNRGHPTHAQIPKGEGVVSQALLVRRAATAYAPTMRTDSEFASEGMTCRGWFYLPYEAPCSADAAGAAVAWFTTHLGR